MLIEIKNRFTGNIICSGEYESFKNAVERNKGDLFGADLSGANLFRADLFRAYLFRANLSGADLSGANLSGADLSGANLFRADLSGANLSGANLSGANLFRANLFRANLSGANLSGANLSGEKLKINPLQIIGLKWFVLITPEYIHIGCERHKAEEWKNFDDLRIDAMHTDALTFWKQYKDVILSLHKEHNVEADKVGDLVSQEAN